MRKLVNIDGISNIIGPFGPVSSEAIYSSQAESEKNNLFLWLYLCAPINFNNIKI